MEKNSDNELLEETNEEIELRPRLPTKKKNPEEKLAQLSGTIEYTNCFSAEG